MNTRNIKTLFYTAALGGLLSITACDDFLSVENNSTLSQDAVFASLGYTNSAIIGVYNTLPGDDGYGSRISTLFPNAADDFRVDGDHNPLRREGIAHYGVAPANTDIINPFNQLYRGIERANICIKYIPLSNIYSNGSAAERATMRKYLGEALTLRAQFYHELIRNWGDIPAQFEPSSDIPDLFLPKMDQNEIYDRLLADLAMASEMVPWRSESGDPSTRVTKAAVKGLRARIALARGGYALRRTNPGNGRSPGEMSRPGNYLEFYEIARNETRDIMQRGENNLNPVYENIFRSLHGSNRQDATNELIWEVGAYGGTARTDTKLGYANGPRIAQANPTYGQANGLQVAVPTYFYEFDQLGDSRRDVTLAYFSVDATSNKLLTNMLQMREGKFRKYWTNIAGLNQTLGINWPLLRYADVLLMFAEAENELSSPTADAIAALDAVRKRAFFDQFESRLQPIPTDKSNFFEAVVKERLLEFGGEGIRKYDLYRWNRIGRMIDETRVKYRQLMTAEAGTPYANVPLYVYFRTTPLLGRNVTAQQEMLSFELLDEVSPAGNVIANVNKVMYEPSPTTAQVDGFTRISWRDAIKEENITGPLRRFASQYKANQSEVFPIPLDALNLNFRLTQDYGY